MSVITEKRILTDEFHTAFKQRGLNNSPARKKSMDAFLSQGAPDSRNEEYRFTPITRTLEKIAGLTDAPSIHQPALPGAYNLVPGLTSNVIVFVNGVYSPEQSVVLDKELTVNIHDVGSSTNECDPFDSLNHAFAIELLHLSVKPSISIQHPVAIVYYFDSSSAVFATPRWRFEIGKNSSLTLLEYSMGSATVQYFNNKQSEIRVGENAQLEYTLLQNGPKSEIELNNTHLYLAATSRVACFTLSFDGQLIRNNLTLTLDGQGIDAHLYGLYLVSGKTLLDNHTVVDHRAPNSYSNQLYKGVMDANGKGIFNGKIFVRPNAQKTNAFQSNRNILLGDFATINTKPQLEIWADDVKCSHGCTTGQLDEEALFYLRSRGISKELAKGMLLEAFAGETLLTMKNQPIRNYVETLIVTKLHQAQ